MLYVATVSYSFRSPAELILDLIIVVTDLGPAFHGCHAFHQCTKLDIFGVWIELPGRRERQYDRSLEPEP